MALFWENAPETVTEIEGRGSRETDAAGA